MNFAVLFSQNLTYFYIFVSSSSFFFFFFLLLLLPLILLLLLLLLHSSFLSFFLLLFSSFFFFLLTLFFHFIRVVQTKGGRYNAFVSRESCAAKCLENANCKSISVDRSDVGVCYISFENKTSPNYVYDFGMDYYERRGKSFFIFHFLKTAKCLSDVYSDWFGL